MTASPLAVRRGGRAVLELEAAAAEAVRRRDMLSELLEEFRKRGPSSDPVEATIQKRLWKLHGPKLTTAA